MKLLILTAALLLISCVEKEESVTISQSIQCFHDCSGYFGHKGVKYIDSVGRCFCED